MFGKKEDLSVLKSENEGLTKQLAIAKQSLSSLHEQVEDYKDTVENLHAEASKAKSQHLADIEEYKLQLKKVGNSVNAKVNAALQSIGVNQFAIETISIQPSMSPKAALDKFNALSGNERTEFYRKHKELISQALNGKSETIG